LLSTPTILEDFLAMSIRRLLTRGKSILKTRTLHPSRENNSTSESVQVAPERIGHVSNLIEDIHVNENSPSLHDISLHDTQASGPGLVDVGVPHHPVKLTRSSTPSPPLRSASKSTRGSAGSLRAKGQPQTSPGLSTYSKIGEAGPSITVIGAAEQTDSVQQSKRRKDEEEEVEDRAEFPRMIGHLTATENEDWSVVLELCEMASASEANAKEAVKALRLEFKYAVDGCKL